MRLRLFVEPQFGATYEDQRRAAQAAEAAGFDAFFRSDHFLTMGGDGRPGPTDAWVTLAGLARDTTGIRLGTLLTSATFRQPGVLAVTVAEVDEMSGGRVELGLGAGWYEDEHRAYGIPFPSTQERFERLEEQLSVITGLWTTPEGSRFAFDGRHYQLADSPALPKPRQRPHPPLIVGGAGSRVTPRLAAAYATEFNTPFLQPDDAAAQYQRVRAACEAAGRDPAGLGLSAAVMVCCATTTAELERRASATGWSLDDLRRYGAAGTPAEVAERLERYAAAGATTAYLQLLDLHDLDQIALLGEEVTPLVASA